MKCKRLNHADVVDNQEFLGYKDALMVPFEQDEDLLNVLNPQTLHSKTNQVNRRASPHSVLFFCFMLFLNTLLLNTSKKFIINALFNALG